MFVLFLYENYPQLVDDSLCHSLDDIKAGIDYSDLVSSHGHYLQKGKKLCSKGKMSIESSYCGVKLEVHWEFLVQGHLGEQLIFRPSLIMMLIEAIHRILIFQQRDLIYSWSMFQARRKVMEEW